MKIKDSIKAFYQFVAFYRIDIMLDALGKKIELHSDYPSLFTYVDVLTDLGIPCEVVKLSEENIDLFPFPILTLLLDSRNGYSLSYVHKQENRYTVVQKEKEELLSKQALQDIWLGTIIFPHTGELEGEVESNEVDNQVLDRMNGIHGDVVGMRNRIENRGAGVPSLFVDIIGNDNHIILEKDAAIEKSNIKIRGNHHVLHIKENGRIQCKFTLEGTKSRIIIEKDTTIEAATLSATESKTIHIGEDCMLSTNIFIMTSDSHSILDQQSGKRINLAGDIRIEDHVWLGPNVNVLKAVTIGTNSIVGINSLVTKDIPSNCVAVGNPAKVIKENTTWDRELL